MSEKISISRSTAAIAAGLLIAVGVTVGIFVVGSDEPKYEGPPPPLSELTELEIENRRTGADPLMARFSSLEKLDGLTYDVTKGSIQVRDGSHPTDVPVDVAAVKSLLIAFNGDLNVKDVPIVLVPNVHEFLEVDGVKEPMDTSKITISWRFYLVDNPKPFEASLTVKGLAMPKP